MWPVGDRACASRQLLILQLWIASEPPGDRLRNLRKLNANDAARLRGSPRTRASPCSPMTLSSSSKERRKFLPPLHFGSPTASNCVFLRPSGAIQTGYPRSRDKDNCGCRLACPRIEVAACCSIEFRVRSPLSKATSTSRIRDSAAARFSAEMESDEMVD